MKNKVPSATTKIFQKGLPVLTFSLAVQLLFMPSTSWGIDNSTAPTPHTGTAVATAANPTTHAPAGPAVATSSTTTTDATSVIPAASHPTPAAVHQHATPQHTAPHHDAKGHVAQHEPCPPAAKPHHPHHHKAKPHHAHHPKGAPPKKTKLKKKAVKKKAPKKKCGGKVAHKGHIWGTVSYNRSRDYFILAESKAKTWSGVVGADYTLNPQITVGLYYSNGYNKSRSPMTALVNRSRGRSDTNSFFANATYNFTPSFYFNFAVGYSYTPNKNTTYDRRGNGFRTIKTKTNVFSLSPSINGSRNIGNYTVSCQLGYSHSNSYRGRATDSRGSVSPSTSNSSDSASFFADFSYNFRKVTDNIDKIAPFVNVGLDHAFQNPKFIQARNRNFYSRSQDGWKAGTGLRFLVANDISINAGWTISGGRTKQNAQLVSLTVRVGAF